MKKHALLSLLLVFLSALATTTRAQNAVPLERRAGEVCAQFRQTPGDFDKMFAPSFLAQVPATQLTAIFADYFSKLGRCTQAKLTALEGADGGRFDLIFDKGYSVPAHFDALVRLGPTIHHRRSFAPVAAAYGDVVTDDMEIGAIEPGVLPL